MKRKKDALLSSVSRRPPKRRSLRVPRPALVLLVDDDPDMRELIKMTLETASHLRVVEANNSKSALACARRLRLDLVISDIARPGMNGLRFLKFFRREHPLVPVIIASGDPKGCTESKAQQLGAFAFLRKPFTLDCLLKLVDQAMSSSSAAKS